MYGFFIVNYQKAVPKIHVWHAAPRGRVREVLDILDTPVNAREI